MWEVPILRLVNTVVLRQPSRLDLFLHVPQMGISKHDTFEYNPPMDSHPPSFLPEPDLLTCPSHCPS
jgi:hypothetical protein